jgi:hypothetical protein
VESSNTPPAIEYYLTRQILRKRLSKRIDGETVKESKATKEREKLVCAFQDKY